MSLEALGGGRGCSDSKAQQILKCPDNPLLVEFELLPSGCRFRIARTKTRRARASCIPDAIDKLNLLA